MFGIDQFSWGQFTRFIAFALLLWYVSVAIKAWLSKKNRSRNRLFEEGFTAPVHRETSSPVFVSSNDFPAELLPLRLSEDIPLPLSLYEESGLDDGYAIECFIRPEDPALPEILTQVHFQQ